MKYKVYYMRPEWFRDGIMGDKPDPSNLDATHIFLQEVEKDNLDALWAYMQGENWSPNGEARPLIEAKGLRHTSMSVGDVAVDEEGFVWLVAFFGFHILQKEEQT
jgi:hypothetical protein